MMEIIHDMAPGASLYFATADNSIISVNFTLSLTYTGVIGGLGVMTAATLLRTIGLRT